MPLIGKKLVIISHTLHAINERSEVVGWGPTVAEINYLSDHWSDVVHVACFGQENANASMKSYSNKNIRFSPIPTFGGLRIIDKVSVFTNAFTVIRVILKELKGASHVQIRVPMGIGVYVLPLFLFIPRKFTLWVKYANNWGHVSSSLGYRFQRWFLEKKFLNCAVTINGFWPNQKKHLQSFENPCITEEQNKIGQLINKEFDKEFKVVFAGRIDSEKGLDFLLEIIPKLPNEKIQEWVFIGDGSLREKLEIEFKKVNINTRFLGFVEQELVHKELQEAHFLVLPSKSEGFPKVVAEAWNYGCIPICSAVGSIPHYLENEKNGFLMSELNSISLLQTINVAFFLNSKELKKIAKNGSIGSTEFRFENYLKNLEEKIFHGN